MKSTRLRNQGFINHHRKLVFRLLAILLAAYLFYAPNLWPLNAIAIAWTQAAGVLLLFAGIIGRTFATISIGGHKDKIIMKTELYSICRNPLYFSSFLIGIGIGLLTSRMDFTLLVAAGYLAIFYPMMRNEAKLLKQNFSDFAEYEQNVPLFFPKFSLWNNRKNFEINFDRVKRTLIDSSLALLAIPVIILLHWIS